MKLSLNLRKLPSVIEFRVSSKDASPHSLLFNIIKYRRDLEITPSVRVDKANKYLSRQYARIAKLARRGDYKRIDELSIRLIERSSIYQAAMLHSASKEWYCKKPSQVNGIWRAVARLKSKTNLEYARWWIDKKPGDFARPIGAPTLKWKVQMLKYLQILEIVYFNQYPKWQHAGISGRGVLSAWEDALKHAIPANFIYEFDLKGFFDNIHNQNSVPELPELNKRINEMVNAVPSKYHLPPVEEDTALQKYLKSGMKMNKNHSIFDREWKATATHGPALFKTDYVNNLLGVPTDVTPEDLAPFKDFYKERAKYLVTTGMGVKTGVKNNVQYFASTDPMAIMNAILARKEIETHDITTIAQNIRLREDVSEEDRALERDRWKNLHKIDHGFPQGANFSPFLSCLTLARAVKSLKGLIMYMDDGLIYASTKTELDQRIRKFKERIQTIGLTLAEEKCRTVKDEHGFYGIKFLGIRMKPSKEVWSETRKGTIRSAQLQIVESKEEYDKMAQYLEIKEYYENPDIYNDLIRDFISNLKAATMSAKRVQSWAVRKSKQPLEALKWATKNGFFGNIVADIFDPQLEDKQLNQIEGELRKLDMVLNPKALSFHVYAIKQRKNPLYFPDITTISTECVIKLLKTLRNKRRIRKPKKNS